MIFVSYAITHVRKIIMQCILLCAFLSAPFAIADHQLSHLADHSVVEQCELCLHSPALTDADVASLSITTTPLFQSVQSHVVSLEPSLTATRTNRSRAPPQN